MLSPIHLHELTLISPLLVHIKLPIVGLPGKKEDKHNTISPIS
jgi:hypothetical protein